MQARPILTNELSDYETPYMMQRQTRERLLRDECARNQLDESMIDYTLDTSDGRGRRGGGVSRMVSSSDLVRLRGKAPMPPDLLEPLMSFRGITEWAHDPRDRLKQKLDGVNNVSDFERSDAYLSGIGTRLVEEDEEDWQVEVRWVYNEECGGFC